MNILKSEKFKVYLMVATFFGMFFLLFLRPRIPQDLSYHLFADEALIGGIPHFFDVVSNFIFIIVGMLGFHESFKQKSLMARKSWMIFFLSIFLIGPGSAYYHWNPNNQTLVWDRLPMGAGFMVLYLILMIEHINLKLEKYLLPSLIMGLGSVIIWAIWDDLRIYFWIQFSSFLCIPIILLSFKSYYNLKSGYYFCLLFYFLAKLTETFDKQIFFITNQLVSGHTLKHLLAGIGLWFLVWMIKNRAPANSSIKSELRFSVL
jgi:hypothetical protein